MICESCGHEQPTGKFCGKCGTNLVGKQEPNVPHQETANQAAATKHEAPQQIQPNVHVEKVKETSRDYWNYYLHYLKNPVKIFQTAQREFVNGLISAAIFALLVGIAFYNAGETLLMLIFEDSFFGADYLLEAAKPSFSSVFPKVVMFILLSMAVVTFSLFVINKFFGPGYSFKEVAAVYGTHLIPFTIVTVAALLLLLMKSYTVGNILLILSISFPISTMPLYIIGRYLSKQASGMDPLYSFISYFILTGVLFTIIIAIIADSLIGNLINTLKQLQMFY